MAFAKRPVIRTTSQVFKIFAWNESKMVSKSTHGSQAIFYPIFIWYFWNHFQNRPSSSSLRTWRLPLTELVKDWRWTCTCTARAARLLFQTNHIIDLWRFPGRRRFLNFPFSFRVVTGDSHWTLSEAYANHSTNPSLPPSLSFTITQLTLTYSLISWTRASYRPFPADIAWMQGSLSRSYLLECTPCHRSNSCNTFGQRHSDCLPHTLIQYTSD